MNNNDFMRGWLRGLWDGEGCVLFHSYNQDWRPASKTRTLTLANTDEHLINKCSTTLHDLGIPNHIYTQNGRGRLGSKQLWTVNITHRIAIMKFASIIGFECSDKAQKLNALISSYQCFCQTCGNPISLGKRLRKFCDNCLSPQALQHRRIRKNELEAIKI